MSPGRKLIVNADDFGLSPGINRGIIEAHDNGIVTSASLMIHMPAAAEAARLARKRPRLSLGLHIDVGEWRYENGSWLPVYERAPQNDLKALEAAVTQQLDLFRRFVGIDPTHLDSHQHVHMQGPLRYIACELAAQLDVPLRHFERDVFYRGDFYGQDEKGRPLAGRLTASFLAEIIERLDEGVTELGCHPAAKLDFQGTYYQERLMELEALCSPDLVKVLERENVLLVSFSNL